MTRGSLSASAKRRFVHRLSSRSAAPCSCTDRLRVIPNQPLGRGRPAGSAPPLTGLFFLEQFSLPRVSQANFSFLTGVIRCGGMRYQPYCSWQATSSSSGLPCRCMAPCNGAAPITLCRCGMDNVPMTELRSLTATAFVTMSAAERSKWNEPQIAPPDLRARAQRVCRLILGTQRQWRGTLGAGTNSAQLCFCRTQLNGDSP